MDPASTISTVVKAGGLAYKGWGWWMRWRYGTVSVTHPRNGAIVNPDWVTLEGTHRNPKGHFWLFTRSKDDYWPQTDLNFHPDGNWKTNISLNPSPGPRLSIVLLVRVSDFMHSIILDIKDRSRKANYHGPIKMKPPKALFSVAQALVLNIEGTAPTLERPSNLPNPPKQP